MDLKAVEEARRLRLGPRDRRRGWYGKLIGMARKERAARRKTARTHKQRMIAGSRGHSV